MTVLIHLGTNVFQCNNIVYQLKWKVTNQSDQIREHVQQTECFNMVLIFQNFQRQSKYESDGMDANVTHRVELFVAGMENAALV